MIKRWRLAGPNEKLSLLCLGAHADDIEIGAGGTILGLIASGVSLEVHWCVLSAAGQRAVEAERSAAAFLADAVKSTVEVAQFGDGYFPYEASDLKAWMAELRVRTGPDVIFTHRRDDAHQDHRLVCELTWNLFRDHLILEYEIPKWDGDLGPMNLYMPIDGAVLDRKIALIEAHFASQRSKDWFAAETFRGLARLRGLECRAPEGYAEAFSLRKAVLA